MFDYKNNPEWPLFCFCLAGITALFLIGDPYIGILTLLLLFIAIQKEIIFPITKWCETFPKFKMYTFSGISIISISCFLASFFGQADDYNELIFLFLIIGFIYLRRKLKF